MIHKSRVLIQESENLSPIFFEVHSFSLSSLGLDIIEVLIYFVVKSREFLTLITNYVETNHWTLFEMRLNNHEIPLPKLSGVTKKSWFAVP